MGIWLVLSLAAAVPAAVEPLPAHELTLSIEEDRWFSGDHSTLCLVRVVNQGRSTLAGGDIGFEARAIRDGRVAARQRGRFGLTLGPHETLETRVAFLGRFDRFEVALAEAAGGGGSGRSGKGKGKSGKKPRSSGGRRSKSRPVI
jgi:uncharacterized membrane protein YgcG